MKKIATVVIQALETADKSLYSGPWFDRVRDTYKAWVEIRRQQGLPFVQPAEWRDHVSSTIKEMIAHYKKGTKDRFYWMESFNLRISITVMGGYKDENARQWETDINLGVVDHGRIFLIPS